MFAAHALRLPFIGHQRTKDTAQPDLGTIRLTASEVALEQGNMRVGGPGLEPGTSCL